MSEHNVKKNFRINLWARLIFKVENEKLHFRPGKLYKFLKGASFGRNIKYIRDVYLDRAPARSIVKKWFYRFHNGFFLSMKR